MSNESRKYGLQRIYESSNVPEHDKKDRIDIIAIHGLDTQSPKTWIAWKIDGDPKSGDVHWLKDETMLPAVIPNSRIFTYDWNANLDRSPGGQFLLGHANDMLSKLYMERLRDGNDSPIIFIASCFGGLLLAKALYRAAETGIKFGDILKATVGVAFFGTPFQGSHRGFYTAIQLRVAVAVSAGIEATDNLVQYLNNDPSAREGLDELVRLFAEMVYRNNFKFSIICFHETLPTDFKAVVKSLPPEFAKHLGDNNTGILVEEHSACLQGPERHGLNVRHSMLSKYADPNNDDFKAVSLHLMEFAEKAIQRRRDRMALRDDPHGLEIAEWLKRHRPTEVQQLDIETLIYEARALEKLGESNGPDGPSIIGKFSQSVQWAVGQSLRQLSSLMSSTAIYVSGSYGVAERTKEQEDPESVKAGKVIHDIKASMANVCTQTQDALLLEPNIIGNLGQATIDEVAETVGAKQALDLKRNVLGDEPVPEFEDLELLGNLIKFSSSGARHDRLRCATLEEKPVIIEMIPYTPVEDSNDISAKALYQVRRMVAQLSHPKRTSGHVLHCAGFVQYRFEKQIGLIFDLEECPDIGSLPITLHELYHDSYKIKFSDTGKQRQIRVALGLRFRIAKCLADAIEGLHRVGWVHKDIQSKNVVFLPSAGTNTRDPIVSIAGLGDPFLFGFESSRPEDAETDLRSDYSLKNNAYRHPDRWGKPNAKFVKAHDVYSLGVIFLELACWKSILGLKFKNLKDTNRCEPEDLRREMLKSVREDIPHLVGQSFATVIEMCLTFDSVTANISNEHQINEVFKKDIVGVLHRLVTAVV